MRKYATARSTPTARSPDPAALRERLEMAAIELGCHNIRDDVWHRAASCWLQAWPGTPNEPRAYPGDGLPGPHRERLAGGERLLDAEMVRLGERSLLDYVRLNIVARRR